MTRFGRTCPLGLVFLRRVAETVHLAFAVEHREHWGHYPSAAVRGRCFVEYILEVGGHHT